MFEIQVPLLSQNGFRGLPLFASFLGLYATTFILMVFCTWADPGSVHMEEDASDIDNGMQRAHWSWQYARHVRRYDHYCKWLKNTILVGFFEHVSFPTPVGMILPND
jgi:hypothetical protein